MISSISNGILAARLNARWFCWHRPPESDKVGRCEGGRSLTSQGCGEVRVKGRWIKALV
ncbi:hypothetical protein BC629DRAFT_1514061 [Irpex lacteus]|nr:hypothetical protein BC629DRAFT_1514061 [Irpex lacteus]